MEKLLRLIFPLSIFFFLFFLCVNFILRVPEKTVINGIYDKAEYPAKTDSIWNGQYQGKYSKWFNENFGKHNFILKIYNQFKYSVFNEGNLRWILGSNKYIFDVYQTKSCFTAKNIDDDYYNYAKEIAEFQKKIISLGKKTIFVLTPCKAEIYPEELPWNYKYLVNKYYKSENIEREKLISAFNANGVIYYDSTEDIKKIKRLGQYPVFYNTGHHWSFMTASNITKRILEEIALHYENFVIPEINVLNSSGEEFTMDKDAYLLLNLFRGKKASSYDSPLISYGSSSSEKIYIYGSSFAGEIFYTFARNKGESCFSSVIYQQYNTIRAHRDKSLDDMKTFNDKEAFQFYINDLISSDILIMEQQTVGGVMEPHKEFIDYLMNELSEKVVKNDI